MSEKFAIIKDYYDRDEEIFERSEVELKPGLTILIGCNGSGKTTLLHQIKSGCKKKKIPVITYDNYSDGGSTATDYAGFMGDFDRVAQDIMSSEGEKISNNISYLAGKIGGFVRKHQGEKKLFILLDAIDSGYSIDNVIEVKRDLFKLIIDDCSKTEIEVYIICSANEYELANGEQCFDVSKCQYVDIGSYEDFKAVVLETRKKKNKRYGWKE